MENICYGCGVTLQTTNEKLIGYTPVLKDEHVLCKRCFRMKNYHDLQSTTMSDHDYISILDSISNTKCLVVYLLDIFDLNGSIIDGLHRHIGDNPVLVLANKRDLLPKIIKDTKLKNYLQHFLKQNNIHPVDIVITSGKKNYSLDTVYDLINYYRNGKDVYVIGNTNVGKSTFINTLLKHYSDFNKFITVSEFPGTTLGMIQIQLDEQASLYDTPGIINSRSYLSHLSVNDLKSVMLNSEVKPQTYQLNPKQTLYIAGLGRIDFVHGEPTSFISYFSKNIEIHRTKLENADKLYNNHQTLKYSFEDIKVINQMQCDSLTLQKGRYDIVFVGIGFVSVLANNTQLKIYHPNIVDVIIRKSII